MFLIGKPNPGHDVLSHHLHVATLALQFLHSLFEVMDDFHHVVICRTEEDLAEFVVIDIAVIPNVDKIADDTVAAEGTDGFHDELHILAAFLDLFAGVLNGMRTFIHAELQAIEEIAE